MVFAMSRGLIVVMSHVDIDEAERLSPTQGHSWDTENLVLIMNQVNNFMVYKVTAVMTAVPLESFI